MKSFAFYAIGNGDYLGSEATRLVRKGGALNKISRIHGPRTAVGDRKRLGNRSGFVGGITFAIALIVAAGWLFAENAASGASCDGEHFVAGLVSLGNPRADFSGFVGMWFTVGREPLNVSCLGRMFTAGNQGTHTLKLVHAGVGTDVPGSTVQVNMAGGVENQFVYAPLAAPVRLEPNTSYYLVSQEVAGGDKFRDYATSILTPSSAAVIKDAVFSLGNSGWGNAASGNRCYGPLDFIYERGAAPPTSGPYQITTSASPVSGGVTTGSGTWTGSVTVTAVANPGYRFVNWTDQGVEVSATPNFSFQAATDRDLVAHFVPAQAASCAPTAFITNTYSLAPLRSDFTGHIGIWFRNGAEPLNVTCLGRMFCEGNTRTHIVRLVRVSDLTEIGSVNIDMTGGVRDVFVYGQLPSPVTLSPNTEYFLISEELLGGDQWHDYRTTTVYKTGDAAWVGAVYKIGNDWKPFVSPNHGYGLVNFRYQKEPVDLLPTVEIRASTSVASESGATPGSLTVSRTGSTIGALTVHLSVSGSATSGTDYLALPTEISIPDGMPSVTILVAPIDDNQFEPNETVTVALLPQEAYRIGAASSGTITIQSDDADPNHVVVPISAVASPAGSGSVTGAGNYDISSLVSLVASAAPGYNFVNWTDHGVEVSRSATYSFEASGSRDLVANFIAQPVLECSPLTLVSGITMLGPLRSDFSGLVGMTITVGSDPIYVSCLGRQFISGNTRTHSVKLVRASDLTDVPGGAAAIDMSRGVAGQFVYQPLTAPVVLEANTDYYLVSEEEAGGDQWHDQIMTTLTTGGGLSCRGPVYASASYPWTQVNSPNHSYGLVDFRYQLYPIPDDPVVTIEDKSFVSGTRSLGALRNDFTGWVGMWFAVGSEPIHVTRLGRQFVSGNTDQHTVKLVRASDHSDVPGGSVEISMAGGGLNQIVYQPLASPITLAANTEYYLVTKEIWGADKWHDYTGTILTTAHDAFCKGAVYANNAFPWTTIPAADRIYGIVDFQYDTVGEGSAVTTEADPSHVPVMLTLTTHDEILIIALHGPLGVTCTVEASDDLSNWQPLGAVTLQDGTATITDEATGRSHRFYRAVSR